MLNPGDTAPDFSLEETDGQGIQLSGYKSSKNVVVYFYPKDDTPGCTVEAQDFTALQDQFDAADTIVLGISRDDCGSHAAFRDKYGLTVKLLSDPDASVCERYGVWQEKDKGGEKKMGIVRSTFIIDKAGTLRDALYGVSAEGHAQDVLDKVKAL